MKKILSVILIIGFILTLTSSSLAQESEEKTLPTAPKTLNEAGSWVTGLLKPLPSAMEGAWQDALRIWQNLWQRALGAWNAYIKQKISAVIDKIQSLVGAEIEKRKPIIKEGLEEEKQEVKDDVKAGAMNLLKGFWDKLQVSLPF